MSDELEEPKVEDPMAIEIRGEISLRTLKPVVYICQGGVNIGPIPVDWLLGVVGEFKDEQS